MNEVSHPGPAISFLQQPTRYIFFTGKGGVGKTALSCATAIRLAAGLRDDTTVFTPLGGRLVGAGALVPGALHAGAVVAGQAVSASIARTAGLPEVMTGSSSTIMKCSHWLVTSPCPAKL